jgi:hypothetical protein
MNSAQAAAVLTKAREEFQKIEAQARESGRRAVAAQEMNHQAKLKFKQAKKWARQTRKLVKRADADAVEKEAILQKAAGKLKKLEKKALKGTKKAQAKTKPAKVTAKPAKKLSAKKPVVAKKKKSVKAAPKIALAHLPPPENQPAVDAALPTGEADSPTMPQTL